MSAWLFDVGALKTCGKTTGAYLRVEMATQDVSTYPLTSPVWTSPTTLDSPFTFSEVGTDGSWDAGQQAMSDVSFEAVNVNIESGGDTRLLDIFDGINKDTTDLHVRVSWSADNSTWYVKFWGVVDWTSLEISYGDFADEDTWLLKFSAADCIKQLERATTADWFTVFTFASFEYIAPGTPILSKLNEASEAFSLVSYGETSAIDGVMRWLKMAASYMRLFRIGDLFQSMSDLLGLEANVCNQVARAKLPNCSALYGYNDNTSTATPSFSWVTAESLFVIGGVYESSVYKQQNTFFAPKTDPSVPHYGFYENGSVAESLKQIATSIGCVCRIEVNASGQRYLNVVEVGTPLSTRTVTQAECIKGAELTPYERGIDGVQVTVSDGSDVQRPGSSSKSVNVDCIFSSCNNAVYRNHPTSKGDLPLHADILTGLWYGFSATSDKNLTKLVSICSMIPRVNSVRATDTAQIDAWGEYRDAATLNWSAAAVMYPKLQAPYIYWTEVPAMGVAHMLYSSKIGTADISVFRQKGQSMRLKVRGITSTLQRPGDTVALTIAGASTTWTIVSCREIYSDDVVEYELERYV